MSMRDEAALAMSKARDAFWVAHAGPAEAVEVFAMERKADLAALDGLLDWLEQHDEYLASRFVGLSLQEAVDLLRGEQRDE